MLKKYSWFTSVLFLLACLTPGNVYAEDPAAAIVDHVLCKGVSEGQPIDVTETFTNGDTVCSWLEIRDAADGDEVTWLFQGPNGIESRESYTLGQEGNQSCHATLVLDDYHSADVEGDWTVTVYLNGEEASTEHFTVEPLTGLVWWGPLVGLLIILLLVAIVAVPIAVIVVKAVRRRKRAT